MAISAALAGVREGGLEVVRGRAERAFGRLRAGFWPVVQTAVAASLAWYVAGLVLGHERPFVAAIAAVISVGAVAGQTLRRAAEWIFGVAVGLAVADLIMLAIGTGMVQTGIIVGLAMTAALLIRGGIMFVTEAGVSALLVANLEPTTYGVSPDRFLEALVGGGVALAVSAAFPSNPSARVGQAARSILEDLAAVHRDVAAALAGGDPDLAERALSGARRLDAPIAQLREELDGGYQIARLSPPRRRHLGHLACYAAAVDQLDFAVRNTRVLARAAVGVVQEKGAAPEQLFGAVLDLSQAVEMLREYFEEAGHPPHARHFALMAVEEAASALSASRDLATSALVWQIQSTALDLLQAAGMGYAEALQVVRETSRRTP